MSSKGSVSRCIACHGARATHIAVYPPLYSPAACCLPINRSMLGMVCSGAGSGQETLETAWKQGLMGAKKTYSYP